MKPAAAKEKSAAAIARSLARPRAAGPSMSYLQTRIRGQRLYEVAFIVAIVELTRRLHQAYTQAYDKQTAEWLLPQDPVSRQPIHWYDLAKIRFDLKTKIASRGRCQEFLTKLLERAGETGGDKPKFTNIVDLFDAVLFQGGFVMQKETMSGRGFSSVAGAVGAPGGAQVRLSAGSEDFKNNPALRIRYYAYDALSELTHVAGSKPSYYAEGAEGAFSDYHLGITARDIAIEMGTGLKNLNLTLPTADPNNDPFGKWSDYYHDILRIFCKRDF